ncbi:MAG TPA: hypothetical protein P5307_19730 [Pirellulaceae bacterium]|nr:hypothetical protein [Pirellulaceae bacterium]
MKALPVTQPEPLRGPDTGPSAAQANETISASVTQVDEGAFMNLTSAIQSIHLKVWVTIQSSGTLRMESIPLNDERALVHAAGRLFFKGDAEEATKQIRQAQAGFSRKKSEWERRVRQSEDDSARRRAMRELQQKKGYHNPIGTRISPAENQFRRLVEALDIHLTLEKRKARANREESSSSGSRVSVVRKLTALPAGFLEAFSAAEAERKEAIVKRFFDVEAELTVEIAGTDPKQKTAKFSPGLPKHRLYYLVDSGQIIRLRRVKIVNDVHYHNVETQQNEAMPLTLLLESVQAGGMWLLRPKADPVDVDHSPSE